jgi:multiple sugar transport system permease protein
MPQRHEQRKAAWLFLFPSLVLYALYVVLPIFFTLYLSTTTWDGFSARVLPACLEFLANSEELGTGASLSGGSTEAPVSCFANYAELWNDDVFWVALRNNLLWLVFFSLSAFVGLALALFFHVKARAASFYKSMFFMPMVFSLVVVGTIWGWFLQPEFGLLEFLLKKMHILGEDDQFGLLASFHWATAGLIVAAAWPHAAYCMVLYLAGLSNLQRNVLEAALIDGVSRWQLLWHIVLPMLRPATIVVTIVTMIGALRSFDLVAIMTGGGPANSSNVLALYMYQQTFENNRYGYGAAIATVLFAVSLLLIVAYLRQTSRDQN